MGNRPRLFRINSENREIQAVPEIDFGDEGFGERLDIQEWIAANPSILGDDLLIISKEFSGFDRNNERLDLLAVDRVGKLVVIELKRDDSGTDVHWQAIKYASYLPHTKEEQIISILAAYKKISKPDARSLLLDHLNVEDNLNALNYDQRIILVSHRFALEVTSAVLWLNEKAHSENLITCVQLTPYRDEETGSLYLQASTIIPAPVMDDYTIRVGSVGNSLREGGGRNPNATDKITCFMRCVKNIAENELSDEIRPDRTSPFAGRFSDFRFYAFYYSRSPWRRNHTEYEVNLFPPSELGNWKARVFFQHAPRDEEANFAFQDILNAISYPDEWQVINNNRLFMVDIKSDALNEDFAGKIADALRKLIEMITPIVDELARESEMDESNDGSDGET